MASEQRPDGEHTDEQAGSSEAVHDDLEPGRDDAEQVTGGRDAATGLPTGKRMHMP